MKELTSNFDDMEKRLAIFIGLGAFLMNSLYCLIKQAPMSTFLIQGVLVAIVFMLIGWSYGHFIKGLVSEHAPGELDGGENVEFRNVDAQHVEGTVVSEMPNTIVQESGTVIDGFDSQADGISGFDMPDLNELAPLPPPPMPAPLGGFTSAPSSLGEPIEAMASFVDSGDLPPPNVPSGA